MAKAEPTPPQKAEALKKTQRHNGAFASGFASLPHGGPQKVDETDAGDGPDAR